MTGKPSAKASTIAVARRSWVAAVVVAVAALMGPTGSAGAAGAAVATVGQGDPLVAPHTTLSGDGRTASDGVRSLTVERVSGLEAWGAVVTVTGSGFDVNKGIYVAMCAIPAPNQVPTPCGGGVDQTGESGASAWITSNPPSYGRGLNTPYGAGGSFTVSLNVAAVSGMLDCRATACAVVTRNDHTRTSDRSQDIFVPISFAAAAPPATQPPATQPPATWPPATEAPDDSGQPEWPSTDGSVAEGDADASSTTTAEVEAEVAAESTSTTEVSTTADDEGDDDGDADGGTVEAASARTDGVSAAASSDGGSSAAGPLALGTVILAALGGGGYALWRRRSSATPTP